MLGTDNASYECLAEAYKALKPFDITAIADDEAALLKMLRALVSIRHCKDRHQAACNKDEYIAVDEMHILASAIYAHITPGDLEEIAPYCHGALWFLVFARLAVVLDMSTSYYLALDTEFHTAGETEFAEAILEELTNDNAARLRRLCPLDASNEG